MLICLALTCGGRNSNGSCSRSILVLDDMQRNMRKEENGDDDVDDAEEEEEEEPAW